MTIFSGIQPTGNLHIGNYLGALKQWKNLQDSGNECFFSVVDLHALTTVHKKQTLEEYVEQAKKVLLAVGAYPRKKRFVRSKHGSCARPTCVDSLNSNSNGRP